MVESIELPSQVRHIYPTNPFATQAGVQLCTTPMRDEDEVGGTQEKCVHQRGWNWGDEMNGGETNGSSTRKILSDIKCIATDAGRIYRIRICLKIGYFYL